MLKLNQGRKVNNMITLLASYTFSVSYTKLDGKNRLKRMVGLSTPAENIVGIEPPNSIEVLSSCKVEKVAKL